MKVAIADPKMYKQMWNRESGAGRQARLKEALNLEVIKMQEIDTPKIWAS